MEINKTNKEELFLQKMYEVETEELPSNEDMRIREAKKVYDDHEMMGYPYMSKGDGKWFTTKEAFELYKKYAEKGDIAAQHNLGYFYYDGECVKKNRSTAIKWFTKAAEQNNEVAQLMLGDVYSKSKNYEEAFKWYLKSAEQGRARSQFMIGEFYSKGMGVTQDDKEAVRWYKKAASHMKKKEFWQLRWLPDEVWEACRKLGLCYYEGRGVQKNDKTAALWYERLWRIMQGVVDSDHVLYDIAEGYYYGIKSIQSYNLAIKWYKRSAQQLCRGKAAQRRLAEIYEEGTIVPQNYKEAYKWYRQLAEDDDAEALYKMGLYYLEGKGVKQNREKAISLIRKSAEQGYKPAQRKLEKLDNAFGAEIIKTHNKNAKKGGPDAQVAIGNLYSIGSWGRKNPRAAFFWYLRAAKQGDRTGKILVADCYFRGKGVKQDYKEAVKWYEQSELEYVGNDTDDVKRALVRLAQCYQEGLGVDKDLEKAARLNAEAAKIDGSIDDFDVTNADGVPF